MHSAKPYVSSCDVFPFQSITLAWGTTYRWLCEPVDYTESPEVYAVSHFDYNLI